MYVCICHAINDGDVHEAICRGADCAAAVYRHFGVDLRCGRCVETMEAVVCAGVEGSRQPSPGPACDGRDGACAEAAV